MALIYRVECEKCGFGPYSCTCDHEFHQDIQMYSSTDKYLCDHPGMFVDVPRSIQGLWGLFSSLHCGFESELTLQYWFADLMEQIMQQGRFVKVIYNVPKFIVGRSGKQVFFLRGDRQPTREPLRCATQYL